MMRLIVWILIIYVAYLVIKNMRGKQVAKADSPPRGEAAFRDPVCGVFVGEEDAVIGRYQGERIYFCSRECLEKYQQQLVEK
jgi:YHS domain-containing protein